MRGSTLVIGKACEFSRDNVNYAGQGVMGLVSIGSSGFVDLKMTDDVFLTGGQLNVKSGNFGDSADMQVIDKDQMLASLQVPGQPAGVTYSMIPGYPVLNQFATNIQIIDSQQKQMEFDLPYVAKIFAGLYLRIVYRSTGSLVGNVLVAANYSLHKALY